MNFFYKKSQFFAKKWVKMSFPDHNDNRKVVHKVENYLIRQFQPKVMMRSQENGQKPHFWKNCLIKCQKMGEDEFSRPWCHKNSCR